MNTTKIEGYSVVQKDSFCVISSGESFDTIESLRATGYLEGRRPGKPVHHVPATIINLITNWARAQGYAPARKRIRNGSTQKDRRRIA